MELSLQAQDQLHVGGIYEHYSGKRYKIICVCYLSEDESPQKHPHVLYEGLYKDEIFGQGQLQHPFWVRPMTMFLEEIEINGKRISRFTFLGYEHFGVGTTLL